MATSIETQINLKINRVPSKEVLDEMIANNQLQPNQLYMLPSELGSGVVTMQTKVLWTNPDPTSAFVAQPITLPNNDYDYFLIRYGFFASATTGVSTVMAKVGEEAILNCYAATSGESGSMYFYKRSATISSRTSITFGNAILGYSTVSTSNSGCIPREIIGIKLIESPTQITNKYSTDETVVGEWIDGKKIYRKMLEFNNTTIGSSSGSLAHNISNIDNVINCTAMMKSTNSNDSYYGYT